MPNPRDVTETEWEDAIHALIRERMAALGIDYRDLSMRLARAGVRLERVPLANKIARKSFGAGFLMQLLTALEVEEVEIRRLAGFVPVDHDSGTPATGA